MKRVLALASIVVAVMLAGCQSQTPPAKANDAPANATDNTGKGKGGPGVADTQVDH